MSAVIDLHSHSYFSDGSLSPTELVQRAHQRGVQILALTDHDETEGLAEASHAAQPLGLHLVNGVEVSVTWEGKTIHIVGLGIDPQNLTLQRGLSSIREERVRRAKKIADKLAKCGIPDVWQNITQAAGFEAVTRTHFARYLLEHGHVKDLQHAFKRYLARNGKAFVNGHWATLDEALNWINSAGGQAVIAHPIRYKMTNRKLEKFVQEFKSLGGIGIEVVVSRSSVQEKAQIASIARRFELKASVGSDFHSPGNPYIELGHNLDLPLETVAIWEQWPAFQEIANV